MGLILPPPGQYGLIFGYVVPDVAVNVGSAVGADGAHRLVGATPCLSWSPSPSVESSLLLGRSGSDKLFYYIISTINSKTLIYNITPACGLSDQKLLFLYLGGN